MPARRQVRDLAAAAHPATDLRTVLDNYDTHQHLGIAGGWPGATADPVRRRVSPRRFKRPATAAIQPPAQQTQTPGTKPAAASSVRIMPASRSEDAAAASTEPPDGPG
jgi:hypothetical protein